MLPQSLTSLWFPLIAFTLLATATPGPNNLLLTLAGSRYGYRRTLPFIFGIRIGICFLFILMGAGIGALLLASTNGHWLLKLLGSGYLVYLAIKLGFGKGTLQERDEHPLLGFRHGLLLQFVNPKSLLMVLSCVSAFSLPGDLYLPSVIQAALIFSLVGMVSNSFWTLFGVGVKRLLATERAMLRFNRVLALLTLGAVALLFMGE